MTLVVCWTNDAGTECWADTRLSSNDETVSDTGAKIFLIPVAHTDATDVAGERIRHYTLGFSFCGSALLAQNTHAIASTCTQMMHSPDTGAVPSAKAIANIYAKAGEYVTRDINSRLVANPQFFQALIFGYCPIEKRLKSFVLTPDVETGSFRFEVAENSSNPGDIIAIGSGAQEFLRGLSIKNSLGENRGVIDVFVEVIDQGKVQSVGGHAQVAVAKPGGVQIMPVLEPDDENPDVVALKINGFNVVSIKDTDGFSFGLQARGVGTERVAGRHALRAKGIDPDRPVSKAIQNTASFEAGLRATLKENLKLSLTESYTLEAERPAFGKWYFFKLCTCGQNAPFCEDPSAGTWNPFDGPGAVNYNCWNCRKPVKAKVNEIRTMRWNLPLS